jgi:hypothetical protein
MPTYKISLEDTTELANPFVFKYTAEQDIPAEASEVPAVNTTASGAVLGIERESLALRPSASQAQAPDNDVPARGSGEGRQGVEGAGLGRPRSLGLRSLNQGLEDEGQEGRSKEATKQSQAANLGSSGSLEKGGEACHVKGGQSGQGPGRDSRREDGTDTYRVKSSSMASRERQGSEMRRDASPRRTEFVNLDDISNERFPTATTEPERSLWPKERRGGPGARSRRDEAGDLPPRDQELEGLAIRAEGAVGAGQAGNSRTEGDSASEQASGGTLWRDDDGREGIRKRLMEVVRAKARADERQSPTKKRGPKQGALTQELLERAKRLKRERAQGGVANATPRTGTPISLADDCPLLEVPEVEGESRSGLLGRGQELARDTGLDLKHSIVVEVPETLDVPAHQVMDEPESSVMDPPEGAASLKADDTSPALAGNSETPAKGTGRPCAHVSLVPDL